MTNLANDKNVEIICRFLYVSPLVGGGGSRTGGCLSQCDVHFTIPNITNLSYKFYNARDGGGRGGNSCQA